MKVRLFEKAENKMRIQWPNWRIIETNKTSTWNPKSQQWRTWQLGEAKKVNTQTWKLIISRTYLVHFSAQPRSVDQSSKRWLSAKKKLVLILRSEIYTLN